MSQHLKIEEEKEEEKEEEEKEKKSENIIIYRNKENLIIIYHPLYVDSTPPIEYFQLFRHAHPGSD